MKIDLWDKGYVKTIEDKLGYSYENLASDYPKQELTATTVAAISRGKDKSNNPSARFKHLLKEAAGNYSFYELEKMTPDTELLSVAGRPLEYVPVIINIGYKDNEFYFYTAHSVNKVDYDKLHNDLVKFGHLEKEGEDNGYTKYKLYTNFRALYNFLLKLGVDPDTARQHIPPVKTKDYFIAELKAPYFVFAQLRTHGILSQVAVSERVVTEDEYWLPEDIMERYDSPDISIWLAKHLDKERYLMAMNEVNDKDSLVNFMLNTLTPEEGQSLLKAMGYKKEIYNRWPSHMKYKSWIIGGWLNNPYQWGHFLLEREAYPKLHKSWVQPQTAETAKAIRKLIQNYIEEINE